MERESHKYLIGPISGKFTWLGRFGQDNAGPGGFAGGFWKMRIMSRLALVVLGMLAASAAFAQDTGSIRGAIKDSTGATVPGATVTLQNEATKFTRNVVSDARGEYYFGAV